MDGWIELRCPLTFLGCKFVTVCLKPNNEKSQLLYNPSLATFTSRFVAPVVTDNTESAKSKSFFEFNKLPTDILLRLSLYLDNYSLLSLSQISGRISAIYRNILRSRLIVSPKWEKITSENMITWKLTKFIWNFAEQAENIGDWRFPPGLSPRARVAAHLATCVYNTQTIHNKPFCLLKNTPSLGT